LENRISISINNSNSKFNLQSAVAHPKTNGSVARCWPLQQKSIIERQQLSISCIGLETCL